MPNHVCRQFAPVVLTLSVMLTACDSLRFSAPPPPPVQQTQPSTPSVVEPAPQRVPVPARKPAPSASPAAAPLPATNSEELPGNARPPVVVGLNRDALIEQFGTPAMEREAPPARVLEFGNGDCRLAAYLYFDTARNDFYTLQYEVNGMPAPHAAVDRCLLRITRDASRR